MSDPFAEKLFDFSMPSSAAHWYTVHDEVMGGISTGSLTVSAENTLIFTGHLSLENRGGFASFRSQARPLGFLPGEALRLKLRGDGRVYSLNLYVPSAQVAFSYRAPLPTILDEWVERTVPLEQFEATSFGRLVPNAFPVNPAAVMSLGIMIGDRNPGPFHLEIATIERLRHPE